MGAAGAVARGSSTPFSPSGPLPVFAAAVSGRDPLCAVHRHPLAAGAVSRAGVTQRRDLPATVGGVGWARCARAGCRCLTRPARRGRPAGLVAGDHRRLADRGEKGGAKVARSLHGKPASRYQLAVAGKGDRKGAPLEVALEAGNLPDQRQLLPLVDQLVEQGIRPDEVWADRGYDSAHNRTGLLERGITPQISQRRRPGEPIPPGSPTREVWRGRKRYLKTNDPQGRHRWPVERTNAWLKARRRIATRRDRKDTNYLAFLRLGMILILAKPF